MSAGVRLGARASSAGGVSDPAAGDDPSPGALVVDARALEASGIGRYLREILARWLERPPFASLVLLGDPNRLTAFVRERRGDGDVRVVAYRGAFYSPAAQLSWLRVGRRAASGAAVTFFPHWDAPLVALPPNAVVTVHDLIPFRVPDAFSAARRRVAWPALRRVVGTASRLVCVSRATAADLAGACPQAAGKITVVPNGVSDRFRVPPPRAAAGAAPYLLAVGNRKPHKNLDVAVHVLARLHAMGHAQLSLVIVGRAFGDDAVERAAASLNVGDRVAQTGEIGDDELHALYAGAGALIFPSRYEGFGLPALEAMAAGAPVVASNTPGLAEAIGDAAPTFDAFDVDGMARRVDTLLRSAEERRAAIARGRARAAEFSWARAADETARVLRQAARVANPAARGARDA